MDKLIHKGYFGEMFRQLRVPGIISACILFVWHISSFLIQILIRNGLDGMFIPSAESLAQNPMYYAYIMGLVLTFIGFSWLNKRSYSDFYHALPVSRTALYFTTFAAILVWMLIAIIGNAVLNALLYFVFGLPFNYLSYFFVVINVIIAAASVVGAVSIACAFSGTRFVNLVASVVILFMPRVMLTLFGALIKLAGGDTLVLSNICWLFDPSFNIAGTSLYGTVLAFLGLSTEYANAAAIFYNMAYAALLVFIGWRVFVKRRSEDAGMPVTNKLFQTFVRCAVGMPLLLILAAVLIGTDFTVDPIVIVLLVLFSFIFYCLYELISTKSMKKVVKAMPWYLVCVGVCLVYIFMPRVAAKAELAKQPEAEQIKCYYVESGSGDLGDVAMSILGGSSEKSYSDLLTERIAFSDARSRQIVSDALKKSADPEGLYYGVYTVRIVVDRVHGRDLVRDISFTEAQWEELNEIWQADPEYQRAIASFPEMHRIYCAVDGLDKKQAKQVAEKFKEEYSLLSPEEQSSLHEAGYSYYDLDSTTLARLRICGCKGVDNYNGAYMINSLVPETCRLVMRLLNEKNCDEGMQRLDRLIADVERYETGYTDIDDDVYVYIYMLAEGLSVETSALQAADPEMYGYGKLSEKLKPLYKELFGIIRRGTPTEDINNFIRVKVYDYHLLSESAAEMYLGFGTADRERMAEIIMAIETVYMGEYEYPVD